MESLVSVVSATTPSARTGPSRGKRQTDSEKSEEHDAPADSRLIAGEPTLYNVKGKVTRGEKEFKRSTFQARA